MTDHPEIPVGPFCYSLVPIADGEVLSDDVERFGKELREFRYHGQNKEVLCPYWRRTDYGTVVCDFLHKEVHDDSWALPDELKICGINDPDSE